MIEDNLDLKRWNFNSTFTKFVKTNSIKIVYRSNGCQFKFLFSRQRLPRDDELTILYGRLHAPKEDPFMIWEGENCRCWHNVLDPLRFFDGLTPHEAMEQVKVLKQLPVVVRGYRESNLVKPFLKNTRLNLPSYYSQCYGSIMDKDCLTCLIYENRICGGNIKSFYGNTTDYLARNLVMALRMKTYVERRKYENNLSSSSKILADYFHSPSCGSNCFVTFLPNNIGLDKRDSASLQPWDGFLPPHPKTYSTLQAGTNYAYQINAQHSAGCSRSPANYLRGFIFGRYGRKVGECVWNLDRLGCGNGSGLFSRMACATSLGA